MGTDGTCTSASATLYFYDPQGNRVGKQQANTLEDYVYDPQGHITSVHDGSANLLRAELYAPGGRHLATWDNGYHNLSGLFWNHSDWLGTERVRTNSNGVAVQGFSDTPYGMNLTYSPSSDINPMHFTGKQRDYESNLDYFGARYFGGGNNLGRFMTPDPLGEGAAEPSDPQSWNVYAYGRNNPTTNTDPTGELYCGPLDEKGTMSCVLDDEYLKNKDQYKDYKHYESNFPQENPDEARVQQLANGINSLHPNDFILAGMGIGVAAGVGVGGVLTYGSAVVTASAPHVATILALTTEATLNPEVQKIESGIAPDVNSPALQRIVSTLYQTTDQLPGGTAGAVRWEQATGELLSKAGHSIKAAEVITRLNRLLATGSLSLHDSEVARALIDDLRSALGGN